jgi:outer membrane protein assembly factor BamB
MNAEGSNTEGKSGEEISAEEMSVDDVLTGPAPVEDWRSEGRFSALAGPLVMAGDKLMGVASGSVFAMDIHNKGKLARTGRSDAPEWLIDLDEKPSVAAHVTAFGGTVYFMDGRKLRAVSLANAAPLAQWVIPKKLYDVARLRAYSDRVVAVHSIPGKEGTAVSCFDSRTGATLFGPLALAKDSAGSVTFGDGALFLVASGRLKAVNVSFGDQRWQFGVDNDKLDSTIEPLVAGEVVLVVGKSIYGATLERGEKKFTVAASSTASPGFHWFTPVAHIPNATAAATKAANAQAARPLLGDAYGARAMLTAAAKARSGNAIATNTEGDVVCFSLADGHTVWKHKVTSPSAPVLIDGVVYITTDGDSRLTRFDAETGARQGITFDLPRLMPNVPLAIGNGSLFLPRDDGSISAHAFAEQNSAYFDGATSMVKVPAELLAQPERGRFDFGTGDFTIEAWFRSSTGGAIVSSHPTGNDPNAHGFCLLLTPEGQIRVAVLSRDAARRVPGRTNATFAADGEWHHLAFARRDGAFMIVLDGLSHEVRMPDELENVALSIGDKAALTIGAFLPAPAAKPDNFFRGLIREVRLWDRAVDIRTIAANRDAALTGLEPRLQGLWRLDEEQKPGELIEPRNAASKHRINGTFINAASKKTDLEMDSRNFPYLMHESTAQWPYAGTWGARGAQPVDGSPAISSNGVVAFSTSNAIYAVQAQDGTRVWAMDARSGTSEPVADGNSFLVMSVNESLVRVDARTGAKVQVEVFASLTQDPDATCARPAASDDWIAAAPAGNSGKVYLWDRTSPGYQAVSVAGGAVVQMAFGDAGLAVITRSGTQHTLNLIDSYGEAAPGHRQISDAYFCMAGTAVFTVIDGAVVKLNASNLSAAASATSSPVSGITGLAASSAHDLLVATTSAGDVYAFSLATLSTTWKTPLPLGTASAAKSVNPPVIDADGRIVCTSHSGAITVLSSETGSLQGFYSAAHGAVETPAQLAGTIFTGCLPSFSNDIGDEVDGALHSIVMGETIAMRLNLDERGNPVTDATQYAVVEPQPDTSVLHLLDLKSSCIEAWINAPVLSGAAAQHAGGGILGIVPTMQSATDRTAEMGYGVNLWIDAGGTLHYASHIDTGGTWTTLSATAAVGLVDGRWHHIAVSRTKLDAVILYVDGQAVNATVTTATAAPPSISETGLKAYIGACAADDLTASRLFRGMIAEVRVWDAWLPPAEIAARMHNKLRGDEPDLIAYWNFDYESVHDAAELGHDGDLADDVTAPVWWLTDLPFTQPAYPYIEATAAITAETEGKATDYEVTLKVCSANGQGIAGERVSLWYLRKRDTDPATVSINTTEVEAVLASHEPRRMLRAALKEKAFTGTTGADGSLKISVSTTAPGHAPALDMWTSFMPEHLRFHVNVLLNNQTLAKPAPPVLNVQSKLIQDYHYSTGNKVDHTRDRSTWRVVLAARTPTGTPIPNEPITLWASENIQIDVNLKTYTINKDNSVTLDAAVSGDLTVVLSAEGLTAPTIYARAGFMHRNDRIVIDPDQDAHTELSKIDGADLRGKRSTNWKAEKDRKPTDDEAMLSDDYAPHANEVAGAIRDVTSSVKPANPDAPQRLRGLSPARRQLLALRPMAHGERVRLLAAPENAVWSPPGLRAMQQPEVSTPSDRVVARRTLAGMARPAPVDPQAFRDAMGGSLGFVFAADRKGGFTYERLDTEEQVLFHRGIATPRPLQVNVGGFFDDMWDGIKDVANDIYDGVTKIVVTIGDKVMLAIDTMVSGIKDTFHAVVNTVSDALNAVAGFFEQLAVGIMKVIAFLRALFDWGNIIKTHTILFDVFSASLSIASGNLRNPAAFRKALRSLEGVESARLTGKESLGGTANEAKKKDDGIVESNANNVQSKSMMDRATTSPARTDSDSRPPDGPSGETADPFTLLAGDLPGLANSILDLAPADLGAKLLDMLKRAGLGSAAASGEAMAGAMSQLADPVDWVKTILETKIEIPFISELYKWITGYDLTLLSVLCLALAVQVNVVYAVITLLMGDARFFFEDAKPLADDMKRTAALMQSGVLLGGESMALAAMPPPTPMAPEVGLMVAKCLMILGDTCADSAFAKTVGQPDEARNLDASLAIMNILQGVAGIVALSLQTFCSRVAFENRVRAVMGDDKAQAFLPRYVELVFTVYGVLMGLRAVKIFSGVKYFLKGNSARSVWDDRKDSAEIVVTAIACPACIYLLIQQIGELKEHLPGVAECGNNDLTEEYRLLAIRDILSVVPGMFEWMYTGKGSRILAKRISNTRPIYLVVQMLRLAANGAAAAVHGVAVFKYGGMNDKARLAQPAEVVAY